MADKVIELQCNYLVKTDFFTYLPLKKDDADYKLTDDVFGFNFCREMITKCEGFEHAGFA